MTEELNPYRCGTCKFFGYPPPLRGYYGYCDIIDSKEHSRELTEVELSIHNQMGCASHSNLKPEKELIKTGDRRTCEYQEIQTYPADEFVMCKSKEKCEFQTPSSIAGDIYCDKPVISHDDAVASNEREELLGELIQNVSERIKELKEMRAKDVYDDYAILALVGENQAMWAQLKELREGKDGKKK